ncbi:MAG: nucleotidyltransferase domain-containing protein [Candidatus ainarchaeum sp.]|nr:nucleotidyltransferase domain-containing protein [Candidatus ainarchaeum sp.]
MAKSGVLAALSGIRNAGLVNTAPVGRMMLYSLARDSTLAKQLKILAALSELQDLARDFHSLEPDGEMYLFGSAARGESTEKSDVDILIITSRASATQRIFSDLFAKRKHLRDLKPVIYGRMDYAMLQRSDPAFYERVEKDKIRLV